MTKPFVLALALAELGPEAVDRRVGTEPSGEAFNAISLDPATGRPANPMINAGAIAVTGPGPRRRSGPAFRPHPGMPRPLRRTSAGGRRGGLPLGGGETGDRNQTTALAYLMRGTGALADDPAEAVETIFRQCAVLATVDDLAVMAATLANGGVNPVTGAVVDARAGGGPGARR
ncbi:glutaminase A [Streptomyces tanashiensis]